MSSSRTEFHSPAGQALEAGEAKFFSLAEAAGVAVFVYQGTRLCYVNSAFARLTGYSGEELRRMNFYDLALPENRKSFRLWGLRIQREGNEPQKQEWVIPTKSGEERRLELTVFRTEYAGKPAGLGIAVEVSALWRARRFEKTIAHLLQIVKQGLEERELLSAIHAALQEEIPLEVFAVAVHALSSGTVEYVYQAGFVERDEDIQRALAYGIQHALQSTQPLLGTPSFWQEAMEQGAIRALPSPPYWLLIPLTFGEHTFGVLMAGASRLYGDEEQCLLEFAASLGGLVLGNARGLSVEGKFSYEADSFSILYEATRDLTLQRNRARLLSAVVEHAMRLIRPSGCALYLCDSLQKVLEAVEARGKWHLRGTRLEFGQELVGQAAVTQQVARAGRYRPASLPDKEATASVAVAVPLIFGGELEGALLVYDLEENGRTNRHEYTSAEMQLLAFFADIAAIALNNATLFEETRRRLVEIEVLYQASLSAAQIHSVRAVAQRIAETLEQLMGWQVSVWVLEGEPPRPQLLAYGGGYQLPEKAKARLEYLNSLVPSLQMGIVGWVCRTGQAVRANDVCSDPRYVEGDSGTRAELCVPLKVGGRVIGCINMESPQENTFSEHDERLLSTLANQAAIAMENARLFEETRRRADRQAAISEIVMAATRAGADLDTFLNTVLDQTLRALGLDMGALWLIPKERQAPHVATRGIPSSLSTRMIYLQESGQADLSRRIVIEDWSKETGPLAELMCSLGILACMAVPLYLEERCIGGLAVATSTPHRWAEEEIRLLEMIAHEVGGAADRVRLFEETQARLKEREAINHVSMALRSARSLNEMLSHLLEEASRVLGTRAGGIWLYDDTDGRLRLTIGRGWVAQLARVEAQREDGIARVVFTKGDIYFSRDVAMDPLLSWPAREIVPANWSALYVPISTDQQTIGVLMVADCLPREFSSDDARLIVTLAEIAGSSIQRMSLYEQTQRHAVELEQRVAERTAELQQALQKAQEADRLKSEFIANINHELRTPLTNLVLYYQMLRAQPNVQIEERLNVIGRELQRLRSLIEDLLNLSRLDSGRASFTPLPHDLNQLLQTLVEDRRLLAQERNLELLLNLEANLPPVLVDSQMISQAFSNLLTNALHYTPSGGKVCVCTMLGKVDDTFHAGFSVQDNGPGIDAEDLPRIFERFYRGRVGRESGASGTGLGLAIVKQVVEYHRGKIEVGPGLEGRGVSFTVWLPLQN